MTWLHTQSLRPIKLGNPSWCEVFLKGALVVCIWHTCESKGYFMGGYYVRNSFFLHPKSRKIPTLNIELAIYALD